MIRHSEPVRPPLANGPERSEGAQGKLREESRSEIKGLRDSSSPAAGRNDTRNRFFIILLSSNSTINLRGPRAALRGQEENQVIDNPG